MPGCNIVVNELLPRYYRNVHQRREFESKRIECNHTISEICRDLGVKFVCHQNITQIHFSDGIHLNRECGISQYVKNLKLIANPLVGVKSDHNPSMEKVSNSAMHTNTGGHQLKGNYNHGKFRRQDDYRYEQQGQPYFNQHDQYRRNYGNRQFNRYDDRGISSDFRDTNINMKLLRLALQGLS